MLYWTVTMNGSVHIVPWGSRNLVCGIRVGSLTASDLLSADIARSQATCEACKAGLP